MTMPLENTNEINTEHSLGKGEVDSSILSGSTTNAREMGVPEQAENPHSAVSGRTEREDDKSGRGKYVDSVHGTDPRSREQQATFVYVIAGEECTCKVGVSRAPKRRLSSLQVSTPTRLSLFYAVRPKGQRPIDVERETLALLKPWRASGEWLSCFPHLAKIAVTAVVENCERRRQFIELCAQECRVIETWKATGHNGDWRLWRTINDALQAQFLDLLKQSSPNSWVDR